MGLLATLKKKLTQGDLPFAEFMAMVLYDPNFGYYTTQRSKFGKAGDFITAPELTPLFALTLANQCQQIFAALTNSANTVIFEFGAGTGRLAVDLLRQLEALFCLPTNYTIIELSADLRARQQQLIQQEIPHLLPRVHWHAYWPVTNCQGVIIANEVLDAMPIHRFRLTEQGLQEGYLSINKKNKNSSLQEIYKFCTNIRLRNHIHNIIPPNLPLPYQSEANLFLAGWLKECFNMLTAGIMLIIDYGFPRHEYYHVDRNCGTLMCHYRHQAHTNPLINLGEQDITTHVDFTLVAEGAVAAGFKLAGFTNQAAFLLSNGLLNLLAQMPSLPTHHKINAVQAVKRLLMPHEMGELYKVMALSKNLNIPLAGFQEQNQLDKL